MQADFNYYCLYSKKGDKKSEMDSYAWDKYCEGKKYYDCRFTRSNAGDVFSDNLRPKTTQVMMFNQFKRADDQVKKIKTSQKEKIKANATNERK